MDYEAYAKLEKEAIDLLGKTTPEELFMDKELQSKLAEIDKKLILRPPQTLDEKTLLAYYEKIRVFREDGKLITKIESLKDAFMWQRSNLQVTKDELDVMFEEGKLTEPKQFIIGWHTYGGYHGFFRPDLTEVIHLLNTRIPADQLDKVKRIYLNTDTWPNDFLSFGARKNMHRAKTTYVVVPSDKEH